MSFTRAWIKKKKKKAFGQKHCKEGGKTFGCSRAHNNI